MKFDIIFCLAEQQPERQQGEIEEEITLFNVTMASCCFLQGYYFSSIGLY